VYPSRLRAFRRYTGTIADHASRFGSPLPDASR
jgi:hypothetical protein